VLEKRKPDGFSDRKIGDDIYVEKGIRKEQMRKKLNRVIHFITQKVFAKLFKIP
jgi:hypothetical protein